MLGDPSKAREKLGWTPKISFESLLKEMVMADKELAKRDAVIADQGYKTYRRACNAFCSVTLAPLSLIGDIVNSQTWI